MSKGNERSDAKTEGGLRLHDRRPTPPGRILQALYMEPRGISVSALASEVGRSRKHVSQLVNGHVRLEADMAERLAEVLGTSSDLWLNLQQAVDRHDARARIAESGWQPSRRWHADAVIVES